MDIQEKRPIPAPVIHGLAIVGFVAVVGAGMALAVFGARYVPKAVQGISAAAVSLVSVFVPADEPAAEPVATSTPATTTEPVATTTTPVAPRPHEVANVYPSGEAFPSADALYGNPDLTVSVETVGYLTKSNGAFVATTTIPSGARRAVVKFIIQNRGTNVAAAGWRFSASLPSKATPTFRSDQQEALLPGERIEYTLGFERPIVGKNQIVSITVRADGDTTTANDTLETTITVTE